MRLVAHWTLFLAAATSALPFAGPATECVDYGDYTPRVESRELPGPTQDIVLAHDLLWIAAGDQGLLIYGIHDPFSPQLLAAVPTHAGAQALAIQGDRAYVAEGADGGLEIFDVREPTSPAALGRVVTPGDASDVVVVADIAYVADSASGLQVIDVSDPETPSIVTTVDIGAAVVGLDVAEHLLVAAASSGVVILDITSPTSPVLADTRGMSPPLVDVSAEGHYAFALGRVASVRVVDFADPYDVAGGLYGTRMPGATYGYDIVADGARAYVLDDFGLEVLDLTPVLNGTDPERPTPIASIPVTGSHIAVHLDYEVAYIGDGDLRIVDLSGPITPPLIASAPVLYWANGFEAVGDTLYFVEGGCCYWARLVVIEASDPDSMAVISTLDEFPRGGFRDIAISGGHAFVTDEGDSETAGNQPALHVFDIADPTSPMMVGQYLLDPPWNDPAAIDVDGHAAVMATTILGLEFLDVSNPSSPSSVATLDLHCGDVLLRGSWAFVTCGPSLRVLDISDLEAPAEVATLQLPASGRRLLPVEDRLYVLGARPYGVGPAGMCIVDVSDPVTPTLVGSIEWHGQASGFAVAGDHAYVTLGTEGLRVVDVSDPSAPQQVGDLRLLATAGAITTHRGRLLTSVYDRGLQVLPLQCSGPSPVALSSFTASPGDGSIILRWAAASESDHLGYRIERAGRVDMPFHQVGPELVRGVSPYEWRDSTVIPGRTYFYRLEALDNAGGLQVFGPVSVRLDPVLAWSLAQSHPNPARSSTAIPFELGAPGRVQLKVFDVAGRLVRTLLDEPLTTGKHRAIWDGHTDSGHRAAAGTYFFDLRAPRFHETRKLVFTP